MESFNLIALTFGVQNSEAVGKDSIMYEFMIWSGSSRRSATDFVSGMPTYWEINLL
jgi:hypothetical protein